PTVRDAWTDYAATRATPPEARDLAIWQRFIEPALGSRAVASLTTGELERWLAVQVAEHGKRRRSRSCSAGEEREARRRAQCTANRRFNLLRAILNSAYRKNPQRVKSADAWRRVRAFQRADRPRTRVLDVEQCQRLLGTLQMPLRTLAQGALYSGCRLGELLALRVADIEAGRVHVRDSKSGRPRFVPLSGEGVAFFAALAGARSADALLFEPLSKVQVSRGMRTGCRAAGIMPPATFHDLRRTYGSLLINSGVPVHVVQDLLGHADVRTTRRAYAHLAVETLRKAVEEHLPNFADASP
ncbi:MAG: tyrosine-type recombinase/integrase, partial [Steroidobacteraceae bacterium]